MTRHEFNSWHARKEICLILTFKLVWWKTRSVTPGKVIRVQGWFDIFKQRTSTSNKTYNSYFESVLRVYDQKAYINNIFKVQHTPRAADFGCRIIDKELFIRNPVVTYVSEMTHFLFSGKNTLTQVSYHSKTTFATKWGRQSHYLEIGPYTVYTWKHRYWKLQAEFENIALN